MCHYCHSLSEHLPVHIMSKIIKDNFSYLKLLVETKSRIQKEALINTITRDQIKCVIEITYNIVHLNIPLTASDRRKLVRHVSVLKDIINRKKSFKKVGEIIRRHQSVVLLVTKTALPTLSKTVSSK